mmetsp:Transcript_25277/g.32886  ORF Transcript_25277/g.32886 Transcript_25277/m.32886 type:complete len:470 (-) Transcript_25277:187-1596(-)
MSSPVPPSLPPDFHAVLTSYLPTALQGNPYFEAGFGLSLFGTALAFARGGSKGFITLTKRHFLVTLEITNKDRSYPWVLSWLTRQASVSGSSTLAQHVSVNTNVGEVSNPLDGSDKSLSSSGDGSVQFEFAPCPGRHFITYGGRILMVERVRADQALLDMNTGLPFETVSLTTMGRSRDVFEKLLLDASIEAREREMHHTIIYKSWGSEWHPFGKPRLRRPLSSVILDDGIAESIKDDFLQFKQSRSWYIDRGIPYRRGYLLHGPPGSGKTSFITALAGELGFDICVLNLGEAGLTDDRLSHALSNMPPRSFALLEDVDAAFTQRDSTDNSQSRSYVTFSGLLNALDGVSAGEERVVFMTTNHITRLDPALIRPGRADVLKMIDDASVSQMQRMFLKFYPNAEEESHLFGARLGTTKLSMALLQGFFMTVRNETAQGALEQTDALKLEAKEIEQLQHQIAQMQTQQHIK